MNVISKISNSEAISAPKKSWNRKKLPKELKAIPPQAHVCNKLTKYSDMVWIINFILADIGMGVFWGPDVM